MTLETSLNRDRYYWMTGSLAKDDDAVVTVTITGAPHAAEAVLEVVLGSAMLAVAAQNGARRTPNGIEIDLGTLAANETRTLRVRFHPKPATRPGRRRVAVVRLLLDGEVSESTTVWARVERNP